MTLPKRVCIVGGGAGGIISAKTLRERGFDVKVYDAESSLGGIWRYQEQPVSCLSRSVAVRMLLAFRSVEHRAVDCGHACTQWGGAPAKHLSKTQ